MQQTILESKSISFRSDLNLAGSILSSVVYLKVGNRGNQLLASPNPKVVIPFPKRATKPSSSGASKEAKARKTVANDDGWIQTKSKAGRKKVVKPSTKGRTARSKSNPASKRSGTVRKSTNSEPSNHEVIDLLDDDDDGSTDDPLVNLKRGSNRAKRRKPSTDEDEGDDDDDLWDNSEESECEFEG